MDDNTINFDEAVKLINKYGEERLEKVKFAGHIFRVAIEAIADDRDGKINLRDDGVLSGILLQAINDWDVIADDSK